MEGEGEKWNVAFAAEWSIPLSTPDAPQPRSEGCRGCAQFGMWNGALFAGAEILVPLFLRLAELLEEGRGVIGLARLHRGVEFVEHFA